MATPSYKIIGSSNTLRYDNRPVYYVVIDPVDPAKDPFKDNVKQVVRALAKENGGSDFSAWVYDDEPVANTEFAHITNPGDALQRSRDEIVSDQAKEEPHLVAIYVGGLSTGLYPYEIDWYPAATTDSPTVGKYVEMGEQWKP